MEETKDMNASESMLTAWETHQERDNGMDIAEEMQKSVVDELNAAIVKGREHFKDKPFYIEMFFKKYAYLPANHVKPHTIIEPLCPTPTHGHCVWKIHASGNVEFLWNVPDYAICVDMLKNSPSLPKEEMPLLQMIVDFANGTLRKKAKLLNGEI